MVDSLQAATCHCLAAKVVPNCVPFGLENAELSCKILLKMKFPLVLSSTTRSHVLCLQHTFEAGGAAALLLYQPEAMKYAQIVMGAAGTGKVSIAAKSESVKAGRARARTCSARFRHTYSHHFAPTGAGICLDMQSTYCHALQEHCNTTGRAMRVINLDPAAETFKYTPSFGL